MDLKTINLLGYGYTAGFLSKKLSKLYPQVKQIKTSRKGSPLTEFDLDNSSTWNHLEPAETTVWFFPAEPLDKVKKFYNQCGKSLGKLIVIGSTGNFKVDCEDQEVREDSPLDMSKERVQGELFLKQAGAVVLYSAGIYGPNRNPIDWVKKGLVGKNKKFVNMVHVEDLCQFILKAMESGEIGASYIAADNNPLRWEEVLTEWEKRELVTGVPFKESKRASKRVNSSYTIDKLGVDLRFKDFANLTL